MSPPLGLVETAPQGQIVGMSVEEICAISKYDPWFVRQIQEIVEVEKKIKDCGLQVKGNASKLDSQSLRGFGVFRRSVQSVLLQAVKVLHFAQHWASAVPITTGGCYELGTN